MTPEIIQMIAQFMQRVTLQGSEVDAYQTCMTVLGQELQKQQQQGEPAKGPDSTDA